jgi:hypothetical protein
MSGWVEYALRSLVGRIDGVTSVRMVGGFKSKELEAGQEVDIEVMLSAVVRRRMPARILGL